MKNNSTFNALLFMLAIGIISGCIAGCASFNATVFNSEKLATDSATQATQDFNLWYPLQTNGASADQIARLNGQRDRLYAFDRQLSQTLATLDGLRLQYATQPGTNLLSAITATLSAVDSQASNIVSLVQSFKAQ